MQGYYIYSNEYDYRQGDCKLSGIDKKVQAQIDTFNEAGLDCKLLCAIHKIGGFKEKVLARMPWGTDNVVWPKLDQIKDADWVYIRKPYLMGKDFRHFLKKIRRQTPHVKVLLEIPTYPYDQELKLAGWKCYPLLWRELFNRVRLKGLVDRIVLVASDLKSLWKIPVLPIRNGLRLTEVDLRKPKDGDGTIRIICAATFSRVHGIDRFLVGMENYYNKGGVKKIELYLAGKGSESENLEKMVKNSNCLKNRVFFLGVLNTRELQEVYAQCDLGIACLGSRKRDKTLLSSSLKSREYLAVGLPFMGSTRIDVFEDNLSEFYLLLPYDESSIDMGSIIKFHQALFPKNTIQEKVKLAEKMRRFAEKTIDMHIVLHEVVDYLKCGD